MRIKITLNGELKELSVPPMKRMLDVLREDFGLLGAKEGCGEGECGACAVLMDGTLVDTCLIPAVQMCGHEILTIEGLSEGGRLDALQNSFIESGAVHCGFCTPGMIMAAHALLARRAHPTREEIRVALAGNICRCTGYEKICIAVEKAAAAGYGESAKRHQNLAERALPEFEDDENGFFFAPRTLRDALCIIAENPDTVVFAGGTDIGPDARGDKLELKRVMDVFSLADLNGIAIDSSGGRDYIVIGAGCTNNDIMTSDIAARHLPALVAASSRSGASAMQNRATIGGNVCTASGAGDLPVVLLALNADVVIASSAGERTMLLDNFIVGYRQNALEPGELLKSIRLPLPPESSRQVFFKRGSRKALTLSRASLAIYLDCDGDRIVDFRAAAGSMSPVPIRLAELSRFMPGKRLTADVIEEAARIAANDVNPRRTPLYRKTMIANLTRRYLTEVLS